MKKKNRAVELTVDIAVIVRSNNCRDKIILIRRAKPPFEDKFVLPGGHVEEDDASLIVAAARELYEEIGLLIDPTSLEQIAILDSPNRDPRGRKISIVFKVIITETEFRMCKAGSDAASLVALDIDSICHEDMGFDHYEVIGLLR